MRRRGWSTAVAAVMTLGALTACESGSGPEVGPADPTTATATSQAPEPSVDPSSEAPTDPTSGPALSEDPSLPAPVLADWDENMEVFAGSPPPVVFASLFGGKLPADVPATIGEFSPANMKDTEGWRSQEYRSEGTPGVYTLDVEVGRLGMYTALAEERGPLVPVGFANCVADVPWCAVVSDDGVITLSFGYGEPPSHEEMVEELRKVIEFYTGG